MQVDFMVNWIRRSWTCLLPAIAAGLFSGRLLSEGLRPGLLGAILITAVTVATAVWLGRRQPIDRTWPALLLLWYVFYPEPDPRQIGVAMALALVAWLSGGRARLNGGRIAPRLSARKLNLGLALAVTAVFLALYWSTLAPDILPADNGEFQLVAAQLGVAHPPGFPLYTLLAHLMTRLPGAATPAYKVNLFSAVTSSLTLAIVCLTVYRLAGSRLAGVVAAVALGTSTTFWAQATTANIRSLTALFTALAIYLLATYLPAFPLPLFLFVLVLTLGVSHHTSLIFMAAVFGVYLLWSDPELLRTPRRWLAAGLAIPIGLLPLLYLPWRAAVGAAGASADLLTLNGFLNYVLGLGFSGDFFYFRDPAILWQRLQVMANVMTFQFAPLLLAGMILGFVILLRRNYRLAFLLGASFAVHTLVTATYRAPQTVEYMLPAYVTAVIGLGYAVGFLLTEHKAPKSNASVKAGRRRTTNDERRVTNPSSESEQAVGRWSPVVGRCHSSRRAWLVEKFSHLIVAVLVVATAGQALANYPGYAWLSRNNDTRDYAKRILVAAPAGTVVLADWHWATPLWYLQRVEGERPDIRIDFVYPTAEPYRETWARRIAEEQAAGQPVIATHYDESAYAALPPSETVGEAFLFDQRPRAELPSTFQPYELALPGLNVLGYAVEPAVVAIGQETLLTLAWEPGATSVMPTSLFAHLVGFDGAIYAHQDVPARPQPEGISLTQFRLTPRPGAAPGDFALYIGAAGGEAEPVRTAVTSLTVTAMPQPPYTGHPVLRTMVSDERPWRRLIGYDWDNTLAGRPRLYLHWQTEQGYQSETRDLSENFVTLPAWWGPWGVTVSGSTIRNPRNSHYVPLGNGIVWLGSALTARPLAETTQTVQLNQQFAAGRPLLRDLVVSVRLIGYEADGYHWAWWDLNDGVPALGAIPTLKWMSGSLVRDPHVLTIAPEAYSGQAVGATVLLYDAFSQRPVPILDERLSQQTPWIPLGLKKIR
jgi:hypothetical protein